MTDRLSKIMEEMARNQDPQMDALHNFIDHMAQNLTHSTAPMQKLARAVNSGRLQAADKGQNIHVLEDQGNNSFKPAATISITPKRTTDKQGNRRYGFSLSINVTNDLMNGAGMNASAIASALTRDLYKASGGVITQALSKSIEKSLKGSEIGGRLSYKSSSFIKVPADNQFIAGAQNSINKRREARAQKTAGDVINGLTKK